MMNNRILYVIGCWPEALFRLKYYKATGHRLNINNPKTLYDKIAYLMFRTDTSAWSVLADKVKVRETITQWGFGDFLPLLLGTWDDAEAIDFESLPNSFVLKTNNASATNILVKDKNKLDFNSVKIKLSKWLRTDYGRLTGQPHYSKIKPQILAEEFLIDDKTTKVGKLLVDYKFYCINGEPKYVQVMCDRQENTHEMKLQVFDMDWHAHPEFISSYHKLAPEDLECPESFNKMISFAKKLSAGFDFVRVDLYDINNKPVFGELSFTPGFDTFTETFMKKLGDIMVLTNHN